MRTMWSGVESADPSGFPAGELAAPRPSPSGQLGRRLTALFAVGAVAVLAAACGQSTTASSKTSSAAASKSSGTLVTTRRISVKGKTTTVLTTSSGRTLYYFTKDTASKVACTGSCTSIWPPLLSKGTPRAAVSLPGTLGVRSDPNGSQVTYNGHPLYTYSGDSKPGQANGEGLLGEWYVATPSLGKIGASSSSSGSYGSGY